MVCASARAVATAILGCCALGGAEPLPQPPCGTQPFPPFAELDRPPIVKVWQHADWTPPACTGWAPAASSIVATTAARFHHTTGAEGLRRTEFRRRRRGVEVPDRGAVGVLCAVGRCRTVSALLGDVPGQRRGGRGRPDGRNRRTPGPPPVAVLTLVGQVFNLSDWIPDRLKTCPTSGRHVLCTNVSSDTARERR